MGHKLETNRKVSWRQEIPDESLLVRPASEFHGSNGFHFGQKKSMNCQKQELGTRSNKGVELVKHMSNLPEYLQEKEYGKSTQEKALRFGVIDWKRLEKWKLHEPMPARSHHKSPSSPHYAPEPQNTIILSPKAKSSPICSGETYPIRHSCHLLANELCSRESRAKQRNSYSQDANWDEDDMETLQAQTDAESIQKKKPNLTSFDSLNRKHPSHNRRFNLSLGRLSRSFSYMDTLAAPQLNAQNIVPKNGPVSCEDKASASGKGRSSPFRRLLEPLLRSKGAYSAKTCKPPSGSLSSMTLKLIKKQQPSTSEALLHLTFKDGLPYFKFAADNGNDILAAAVNELPTSGKGDGCLIYSFCKVPEIKKKTGSKECGVGYNVIAMMKVSSSCIMNSYSDHCEDESVLRQSILYGVDFQQGYMQAPEFLPNKEMAAIMVMNQITKYYEREHSKREISQNRCKEQNLPGDCYLINDNIVVILPGAIHGLPHKGAPSSLIERWRSGGLCDCGGWDVGCKLRVFTGEEKNCDNLDCISLFVQGGKREKKPMFWLSPLKNGLYSIQYDASMGFLEAFSTCVAILTSQKLSHILELPMEEKAFLSASSKASTTIQGQGPARYIPSPPPSPVARI